MKFIKPIKVRLNRRLRMLIGIFLLLFFYSCNNNLQKNIIGLWQIESLKYNDKNIIEELSINTISFRENSGSVPRVAENERDDNINWQITHSKSADSIYISSRNPVFNDKFQIKFAKHENKIFAQLLSKNTIIEIRKIDLGI